MYFDINSHFLAIQAVTVYCANKVESGWICWFHNILHKDINQESKKSSSISQSQVYTEVANTLKCHQWKLVSYPRIITFLWFFSLVIQISEAVPIYKISGNAGKPQAKCWCYNCLFSFSPALTISLAKLVEFWQFQKVCELTIVGGVPLETVTPLAVLQAAKSAEFESKRTVCAPSS
jgi:hypothetical protein